MEPLDAWISAAMSENVRTVAPESSPAWIAASTTLLRWPDRSQAARYVAGFRVTGVIESSGVFRAKGGPIYADAGPEGEKFFGIASTEVVEKLLHSRPPKDAAEILEATIEEQRRGWLSDFLTLDELNKLFGKGSWRFVPRFMLTQKMRKRIIDDANRERPELNDAFPRGNLHGEH